MEVLCAIILVEIITHKGRKCMKNFIITVFILGAIAFGMSKFNPTKADYDAFIDKSSQEKVEDAEGLSKLSEMTTGAVFAAAVKSSGVRKDYFVYSTYEADVFGKKVKYFGMLKNITLTVEK